MTMNVTVSHLGVAVVLALIGAAVVAGVAIWRRRLPGRSRRDNVRSVTYLTRYASALEYHGLRRREIVEHVDQIRADLLAEEATGVDVRLARLGPPRALAAAVTDGVVRPSVLRGAIWAASGFVVSVAITLLAAEAFLGAFESIADPAETATWSGFGIEIDAAMGDDGRASEVGFGGFAMLVVPLVAGLAGARVWRLLARFGGDS